MTLENITLNSTSVENPVISVAGGSTLNVKNSNIKGAYNAIENSGQTTITDSNIEAEEAGAITNNSNSIMNISKTTIISKTTNTEMAAVTIIDGSTMVMNNTSVTAENTLAIANGGDLELNGTSGSVLGKSALKNMGDVRINGATLESTEITPFPPKDKTGTI